MLRLLFCLLVCFRICSSQNLDSTLDKNQYLSAKEISTLHQRCPCASQTIVKIRRHLQEYKKLTTNSDTRKEDSTKNSNSDSHVQTLISEINSIANNCISQKNCRCPENYFKSRDNRCLKFSRQKLSCQAAVKSCQSSYFSRLAVAKNPESLKNLQTYLYQAGETHHSEYYWIGLSYNKNDEVKVSDDDPSATSTFSQGNWIWEDQTYVRSHTKSAMGLYEEPIQKNIEYAVKKNSINKSVKKMFEISNHQSGDSFQSTTQTEDLLRVAIKADQDRGLTFETGFCESDSLSSQEIAKHRFICEFLMFQVDVVASRSSSDLFGDGGQSLL